LNVDLFQIGAGQDLPESVQLLVVVLQRREDGNVCMVTSMLTVDPVLIGAGRILQKNDYRIPT
jgi:hypothetical protein